MTRKFFTKHLSFVLQSTLLFLTLLTFAPSFTPSFTPYLSSSLEAKLPEITDKDVNIKVQEMLESHASHKELTTELMKRTLKNYLEELDPNKIYFIEADIKEWLEPSESSLESLLKQYQQSDFSQFIKIHNKMIEAINRRREIDKNIDWNQLPPKVKAIEFKDMTWVKNEDELKNRIERIRSLQVETSKKLDPELSQKAIQRIEKNQKTFEDEILNQDPTYRNQFLLSNIIKATAGSLDAHTAYFTPGEAAQFMISVQQRLYGIGAQLRDDLNGLTVVKLIDGGPAALGGELKAKDRIIAVNNEPIVGMDISDAVELIRGKEGTPVTLRVIREIDKKKDNHKEESSESSDKSNEKSNENSDLNSNEKSNENSDLNSNEKSNENSDLNSNEKANENSIDYSGKNPNETENTKNTKSASHSDSQNDVKEEQLEITITRGEVVVKEGRYEQTYEPFGSGSIGYIKLNSFYQDPEYSSTTDLAKEIQKLKDEHQMKGLILDLRYNSGGLLSQAVGVTGLFIKKGVVVGVKDNTGEIQYLRNLDDKVSWDGPLIVLINRASASASEIVAQTLQDYGRAIVVGDDHSFGKGSFQTFTLQTTKDEPVNNQGEYKVTRGRYYTVSGKTPQLTGVLSDIIIPGALSEMEIGEKFSKYPLENDSIKPNFEDDLSDVPFAKRQKIRSMYKFDLQPKLSTYASHIDTLKKNAAYRIEKNKNYQNFLKELKKHNSVEGEAEKEEEFGQNDLQLMETYNVMKDLIEVTQSKPKTALANTVK